MLLSANSVVLALEDVKCHFSTVPEPLNRFSEESWWRALKAKYRIAKSDGWGSLEGGGKPLPAIKLYQSGQLLANSKPGNTLWHPTNYSTQCAPDANTQRRKRSFQSSPVQDFCSSDKRVSALQVLQTKWASSANYPSDHTNYYTVFLKTWRLWHAQWLSRQRIPKVIRSTDPRLDK